MAADPLTHVTPSSGKMITLSLDKSFTHPFDSVDIPLTIPERKRGLTLYRVTQWLLRLVEPDKYTLFLNGVRLGNENRSDVVVLPGDHIEVKQKLASSGAQMD